MIQIGVLLYGLLAMFVLTSAARNRRTGRNHAPMLVYVGYLLCGVSAGAAVALPIVATLGVDLTAFA